jgi:hypothetical protein
MLVQPYNKNSDLETRGRLSQRREMGMARLGEMPDICPDVAGRRQFSLKGNEGWRKG